MRLESLMASPADRERQVRDDVERIAEALCREHYSRIHATAIWPTASEAMRDHWRGVARALLESDVVRVGRRPEAGPAPMEGQLEIGDDGH